MTLSLSEQHRKAQERAQTNQPPAQLAKVEKEEMSIDDLQAEIARLQVALASEKDARTEAQQNALAAAQATDFFTGNTEEKPTGRTVKMRRCSNPWVKEEKKQHWIDVDVPTYYYLIDLPPGAGSDLATNGEPFYHGQTYEFDLYTLADIKSRVARCWDHENSIHGGNENEYRKPLNTSLMSAAARQRGTH